MSDLHCPLSISDKINYKYIVIKNKDKTWSEAEKYCLAHDSHLTSIHSRSERSHIWELLQEESYSPILWTGLSDRREEGKFLWSDGSPLLYTDWKRGWKNNPSQNCVILKAARSIGRSYIFPWDVTSCNSKHSFICKQPQG